LRTSKSSATDISYSNFTGEPGGCFNASYSTALYSTCETQYSCGESRIAANCTFPIARNGPRRYIARAPKVGSGLPANGAHADFAPVVTDNVSRFSFYRIYSEDSAKLKT
jgi:hypothetical protein